MKWMSVTLFFLVSCGAIEKAATPDDKSTVVALTFAEPSQEGAFANAEFDIEIVRSGTNDDAKWDVYYTTIPGATSDGIKIASDISFSKSKYRWDTSGLEPGSYYLYAELFGNEEKVIARAKGPVRVVRLQTGNDAPNLSLTNFAGQEVVDPSDSQTIKFAVKDPNDDPLDFKFQFSTDGGKNFTDITGGSINNLGGGKYSYTWDLSDNSLYPHPSIEYRLRVIADDGKGGYVTDTSWNNFAVTTSIPTFESLTNQKFFIKNCSCHTNDNPGGFDATDYYGSVWGRGDLSYPANMADKLLGTNSMIGKPMSNIAEVSDEAVEDIVIFVWGGVPEK